MTVKIKKGAALGSLSITPLIDVVFLLLIYFLVGTRFVEEDRELDVQLPSASEAKPLTVKPREIFVNVDRTGQYFLDGGVRSLGELEDLLRAAARNNPLSQTVRIRADKRCTWDSVAMAIDACHRAGIHDIYPTTDSKP